MANLLELHGICVAVNGCEILHSVDLAIPEGTVHALLGPNGCGKTTLVLTLMGYSQYEITAGHIFFDGEDVTACDITTRARLGFGLAQQRPPTIAGVTLQHLLDYAQSRNPNTPTTLTQLMAACHIEPFLPRDINAGLSGGEIKRSELFQLLVTQPKFAMLDEPDSGIDLESLALVGKTTNQLLAPAGASRRRAGLIITHTGHILEHTAVDQAHVMIGGHIVGTGEPEIVLDHIRRLGFEGCVQSLWKQQAIKASL